MKTALVILALFFTIYGEWKRYSLLHNLVADKKLSRNLVKCDEFNRFIKITMILISSVLLCLFLNKAISQELSFCLLAIELVIPTKKW
jgi:hypothetical protein